MAPSPPRHHRPSVTLHEQNGLIGSALRFWQRSYASEYVGLAMLLIAYMLVQFFAEPFHRMFSLDNIMIQFPHTENERVPVPMLFVYAGAVPLATLLAWSLIMRFNYHKMHVTTLGFFISIILTSFITDVVKNAVGRPRPDLIARCKPARGTPDHELVTWTVCTEADHHTLHDGWRSFPSGHSSFAFSGLGYLALFFAGQLAIFRPRTDLARVLIGLGPLLGAALIAISRCEDYRHDVYDVTIGSILGMFVSWFTYRRYYPPLRSKNCDTPYPGPTEMDSKYGKLKDDEERRIQGTAEYDVDDMDDDSEGRPLTRARQ